jgi:hypothetical protein
MARADSSLMAARKASAIGQILWIAVRRPARADSFARSLPARPSPEVSVRSPVTWVAENLRVLLNGIRSTISALPVLR